MIKPRPVDFVLMAIIVAILLTAGLYVFYPSSGSRSRNELSSSNSTPARNVQVTSTPITPQNTQPTPSPQPSKSVRPSPTPSPSPDTLIQFGDGTYKVGSDIAPGTYKAEAHGTCYWARLRGFSGETSDIIANGARDKGSVIVTIKATDKGFETSGCDTWYRED